MEFEFKVRKLETVVMGCLLGQCQMFIDVLYQFIFKGNFLLKSRLFSFSAHEFDLHAPRCIQRSL